MTRINCIPTEELTDKHLLAEYREIPRLFKQARAGDDIPASYRMGAGHVKFFYDKLAYIASRWEDLCCEMKRRGFNTSDDYTSYVRGLYDSRRGSCLFNSWQPDDAAIEINRQRIEERK